MVFVIFHFVKLTRFNPLWLAEIQLYCYTHYTLVNSWRFPKHTGLCMLKALIKKTVPIILVGVALGLTARWFLGVENTAESGRHFKQPIDPELIWT